MYGQNVHCVDIRARAAHQCSAYTVDVIRAALRIIHPADYSHHVAARAGGADFGHGGEGFDDNRCAGIPLLKEPCRFLKERAVLHSVVCRNCNRAADFTREFNLLHSTGTPGRTRRLRQTGCKR
jgi:hypothetical protein